MKFDLFPHSFKEVTDEKNFFFRIQDLCQYPHSCISLLRDGVNMKVFFYGKCMRKKSIYCSSCYFIEKIFITVTVKENYTS